LLQEYHDEIMPRLIERIKTDQAAGEDMSFLDDI
jgi:hypothetical protein